MVEYTLKRSRRRKTVAMKIQQQSLTVYAPYGVAIASIEHWLQTKQDWIQSQKTKQSEISQTQQLPLKTLQINVFGSPLKLSFDIGKKTAVDAIDSDTMSGLSITISSRVKHKKKMYQSLLEAFMHEQLENYIEMRIHEYCMQMGEELPTKLKIMAYKRRWGSCNRRRELTFNLLLVGAPKWVIDYVVVHELSHLKYLNHSTQFWLRVGEFYPQYKKASNWLKEHGMSLQWVFD